MTDAAPEAPLALLPGAAVVALDADTDEAVIAALAARLLELGHVRDGFPAAVLARERAHPTGLPTTLPVAIPHTDPEHVIRPGLAIATLPRSVPFGQMGAGAGARVDVRLVVMLVLDSAHAQLEALARLIARIQNEGAVRELLAAADDDDLARRATRWLDGPGA